MTNSWDQDWESSLDDGHEFADRLLSDEPAVVPGIHRSEDDSYFDRDAAEANMSPGAQGRARRIDPGVIEAKFPGTCVECRDAIVVNEPVTNDGRGWRHAGCGGAEQTRPTTGL